MSKLHRARARLPVWGSSGISFLQFVEPRTGRCEGVERNDPKVISTDQGEDNMPTERIAPFSNIPQSLSMV